MKLKTFSATVTILGSVVVVPLVAAAEPAAAEATEAVAGEASAKEQIEVAIKAYNAKSSEFMKKLRSIKDRNKMMEVYRNERPSAVATVDLIIKLAHSDPKAEGVERGLVWAAGPANPQQRKEVGTLLLTHYKDSQSIGELARVCGRVRGGEECLREIIAKAGDEKVRQGASYYLASMLIKNDSTKSEGLQMMKKLVATPGLDQSNPALHARAKGEILVAEKLGIGCTAPDIVGTDHEDKEFKLSDYRGSVVLLDFWGIW